MMTSQSKYDVLISEVGPRDGLQSVKATMATADKFKWIDALHASGIRDIEVASFVPARLLPQMADAAEIVKYALTKPGWTVMALVPNLRGAQAALQAGVHKITVPVSASAAHSLANVRMTREAMVEEVRCIAALRRDMAPGVKLEAGMSTAFGCTLQGAVTDDDVVWLAAAVIEAGADEIGLSDTTGMANPAQVRTCSTGCAPRLASALAPPTCTTHAAWAWPIAWQRMTWVCARSMPHWVVWAAAPTHLAPPATWSLKTWFSCSKPWA